MNPKVSIVAHMLLPLSRLAGLNPLLTLTQSCLLCPEATAAQPREIKIAYLTSVMATPPADSRDPLSPLIQHREPQCFTEMLLGWSWTGIDRKGVRNPEETGMQWSITGINSSIWDVTVLVV